MTAHPESTYWQNMHLLSACCMSTWKHMKRTLKVQYPWFTYVVTASNCSHLHGKLQRIASWPSVMHFCSHAHTEGGKNLTSINKLAEPSPYHSALINLAHDRNRWNTLMKLKTRRLWGINHITLIRGGISPCIHVAWIILPRHHAHKISNKRRNTALEDCRVATNHILIVHLGLVKLLHNCNTDTCYYIRRFVPYSHNYHSQKM